MVTLLELCTELGDELRPAHGGSPASRELSGVHVSELEDPTPYLEGGELLLTTGMPLGQTSAIGAYVSMLRAKGVHGLGLGLGPWQSEVPESLKAACSEADIDLLIIPDGVPFQNVSRAYWELWARGGRAELIRSLGTQTALARAAMRSDATTAVIRGLAQDLDGWAAYLPAGSTLGTYWPDTVGNLLPRLREETVRLNRTGAHSAATFELEGEPVVEYPIADGDRILGFLAVGPGRVVTDADRQIILTVCTLLAMKARHRQAAANTAAAFATSVAKLLLQGHPDAARSLAEDAGLPDLPPRVRILAVQGEHVDVQHDDVAALLLAVSRLPRTHGVPPLGQHLQAPALRHEMADVVYLVLTEEEMTGRAGPMTMASAQSPGLGPIDSAGALTAALSEPVPLSDVAGTVPTLRSALHHAPTGAVVGTADPGHTRAQGWVETLANHPGPELGKTVASYLRHRGHWENVARELRLHRNSVRHRIGIAQSLLGVDLDDPDVFAPLWLALRRHSW